MPTLQQVRPTFSEAKKLFFCNVKCETHRHIHTHAHTYTLQWAERAKQSRHKSFPQGCAELFIWALEHNRCGTIRKQCFISYLFLCSHYCCSLSSFSHSIRALLFSQGWGTNLDGAYTNSNRQIILGKFYLSRLSRSHTNICITFNNKTNHVAVRLCKQC